MKQFYPDGNALFLDESATIHRAWWFTEGFDEYKNDVRYAINHQILTLLNMHGRFCTNMLEMILHHHQNIMRGYILEE